MQQLSVVELAAWLASENPPFLLDVREHWEVEIAALPGAVVIPMGQINTRLNEIATTQPVVCVCHHGMRSMQVALFLEHNNYQAVYNLTGGIDAWSREVDPSCPTY